MKRCSYCGKQYPDEATVCITDGESLRNNNSEAVTAIRDVDSTSKKGSYLSFPEYQWAARDAWKCLGMILIFEFLWGMIIYAIHWSSPDFVRWYIRGIGYCSVQVMVFAICVLTVAYFARTETLAAFLTAFDLNCKPTAFVWFGISMALIIKFTEHFLLIHGVRIGVSNDSFDGFSHSIGFERYLFLCPPLILSPIFEEIVNRGYIYKAFRRSYPVVASVALIVAWTAVTHSHYYLRSFFAAFELSLLTLVQCFLREKSNSLWDCILCHFTYNASNVIFGFFR